jgi:hypothetical protein
MASLLPTGIIFSRQPVTIKLFKQICCSGRQRNYAFENFRYLGYFKRISFIKGYFTPPKKTWKHSSIKWIPGVYFPAIKRPEREIDVHLNLGPRLKCVELYFHFPIRHNGVVRN